MKLWIFLIIATIFLSGCDMVNKNYNYFSDIPSDDGIRSWLPDFFPKKSMDIKFTSNLDLNYFNVYFSINKGEGFIDKLEKKNATLNGLNFIKRQHAGITFAICVNSNYNLFGEKSHRHFLLGIVSTRDKFLLTSITSKQYNDFC